MFTYIYNGIKNILSYSVTRGLVFTALSVVISYGALTALPAQVVHAGGSSFDVSGGPGGLKLNGCVNTGFGSFSGNTSSGSYGFSTKKTCNGAMGYAIIILDIINSMVVPFIFALSFTVFIWGIFKYFIAGSDNPDEQSKGWKLLMYGLIGLAIMMSVWGLVNIILLTFNLNTTAPPYPYI